MVQLNTGGDIKHSFSPLFLDKSGLQDLKQLLTIKTYNRLCVLLWFPDSLPHFLFFSVKLSQAFQVTNFLYIKKKHCAQECGQFKMEEVGLPLVEFTILLQLSDLLQYMKS